MAKIVGVRFKTAGKIFYFEPNSFYPLYGEYVIVETARGVEIGKVAIEVREVSEEDIVHPLKPIIRIASAEDLDQHEEHLARAKEAIKICKERVVANDLRMNLVDAEYTFDGTKLIFYFTADGRIDFRNLVKELAGIFRTRIELRQIGARDETKIVKGLSPCGREACCGSWQSEFATVSIKMARDQNLSLNPTNISGLCGRLMCCLKFEHDTYVQIRVGMPNRGDKVETPHGIGIVQDTDILRELVKVRHFVPDKKGELSEEIIAVRKADLNVLEAVSKGDEKSRKGEERTDDSGSEG